MRPFSTECAQNWQHSLGQISEGTVLLDKFQIVCDGLTFCRIACTTLRTRETENSREGWINSCIGRIDGEGWNWCTGIALWRPNSLLRTRLLLCSYVLTEGIYFLIGKRMPFLKMRTQHVVTCVSIQFLALELLSSYSKNAWKIIEQTVYYFIKKEKQSE